MLAFIFALVMVWILIVVLSYLWLPLLMLITGIVLLIKKMKGE